MIHAVPFPRRPVALRRGVLAVCSVVMVLFAAACAPPTGPTTTTTTTGPTTTIQPPVDPPVISAFAAQTTSATSPVTTAFTWTIADPNSSPLGCSLDLDDDGTADKVVADCTSASLRTGTFVGAGENVVTLTVSNGSSSATATATVTVVAPGSDPFDITLRINPSIDAVAVSYIEAAASRWEQVVTRGLDPAHVVVEAGFFFPSIRALDAEVDDVFIDVSVEPLDGPQGSTAVGGGFHVRPGGTTSWGFVVFDSADIASLLAEPQDFANTILHEIGHVLANDAVRLPLVDQSVPSAPVFTGSAANGVYQELGGTGRVPMSGNGHWSEAVFQTELMTPQLNPGVGAPLSALTVASLADQGYGVNLAAADPYQLPTP